MKKIKENILPIINIIIPIIAFVILLFTKLSENTMYFMVMSLVVGWIVPYFVLLITGLSMFQNRHPKLSLVFNIVNLLLTIMLIVFVIRLYDKYFLVFLIEYIVILLIAIANIVYFITFIKNNKDEEIENIKKIKKDNNGIIV